MFHFLWTPPLGYQTATFVWGILIEATGNHQLKQVYLGSPYIVGIGLFNTIHSFRTLADPELHKWWGQIFSEIFERPFLGVIRKNFCISPKNVIYLPKFLMTFFPSHRPFSCFNVVFFRTRHQYGGQNPYISTNSQLVIILSASEGGQTPLPTSMGGHGRICPPLDPPLIQDISIAPLQVHYYSEALPTTALIVCQTCDTPDSRHQTYHWATMPHNPHSSITIQPYIYSML